MAFLTEPVFEGGTDLQVVASSLYDWILRSPGDDNARDDIERLVQLIAAHHEGTKQISDRPWHYRRPKLSDRGMSTVAMCCVAVSSVSPFDQMLSLMEKPIPAEDFAHLGQTVQLDGFTAFKSR